MVRIAVATEDGHKVRWEMTAVPERRALRADDGTWLEMTPDVAAVITKLTAGRRRVPGLRPDGRRPAAGAAPGGGRHRQPAVARRRADRPRAGGRRRGPRARRAGVAEVQSRFELSVDALRLPAAAREREPHAVRAAAQPARRDFTR